MVQTFQFIFYWHLPFKEQSQPKCKYFSVRSNGEFSLNHCSCWDLQGHKLSIFWALFSYLVTKPKWFSTSKILPNGTFSNNCWKMWSIPRDFHPEAPKWRDLGSKQLSGWLPPNQQFQPWKEILNEALKDENKLGCVQRQRGGSRRCCCHHLVCHQQPGDIMPRVDSWGQWQGFTALPLAAGGPGKCVCVPQTLPGDLNCRKYSVICWFFWSLIYGGGKKANVVVTERPIQKYELGFEMPWRKKNQTGPARAKHKPNWYPVQSSNGNLRKPPKWWGKCVWDRATTWALQVSSASSSLHVQKPSEYFREQLFCGYLSPGSLQRL